MFLLLTRVLLWVLVALLVYNVLLRWIPKAYLTWLGGLLLFAIIVLAFLNPNEPIVSAGWQILSFPLKPLGFVLTLLLMAISTIKGGGMGATAVNQVRIATIVLLLSSIPVIAYGLAQQAEIEAIQLEQRRQQICQVQCPDVPVGSQTAGAIVVLGQGTTQANIPPRTQIQLTDTGNRILYAAQLYNDQVRLGNNPIVIVSAGPRSDVGGTTSEANDIQTLLVRFGVPANRVVVEPRGVDIRTSAERVSAILNQQAIVPRRVILVSSGLNIRRANLAFSNLGIQVIPRPTNFYSFQGGFTPGRNLRIADFIPSIEAFQVTTRVVEEYLTSIYYFLRGWLTPVLL